MVKWKWMLMILMASCLLGCVRANIQVVDQRTALENQIIGSYEELSKDLQLLSSVRAVPQKGHDTGRISNIRTRAIRARQVQQFIQDDVDSLKASGCIGEARNARLVSRPCKLSSNPQQARLIERTVRMENSARTTLLNFIIATSANLTSEDEQPLTETWAAMRIKRARSGEWVQEADGSWKKKP